MAFTIDINTDDNFFSHSINLDGIEFILRFRFNQRDQRWYLAIYSADDALLAGYEPILINQQMFTRAWTRNDMPAGKLICVSSDDSTADFTKDDLGVRALIVYYEKADL